MSSQKTVYKLHLKHICLSALILLLSCKNEQASISTQNHSGKTNPVYEWAEILLQAVARDTERFNPRPTVSSRLLAFVCISVYDAWTRYDEHAEAIYLTGIDKTGTQLGKVFAIESAAYHAIRLNFPADSIWIDSIWQSRGHKLQKPIPDSPEWIGYEAATQVKAKRMKDGANEDGLLTPSKLPYADYTGYVPANTADKLVDPSRWQPKYFTGKDGSKFAPGCLTPHWHQVRPVALQDAAMFRSPPPPALGSDLLKKEVEEVMLLQREMSPEEKSIVEFMRDGPASVQQAGHWLRFAMDVSRRDDHTADEDVLMFTAVSIAAMDAFIACWDTKMYYDYPRPYALIRMYYPDVEFKGWCGIEKGFGTTTGTQWQPYSPASFLCPPFPAYVSGHSTVSGACAEVLKLCTGSDSFGIEVPWFPGCLTENGIDSVEIVMKFPTFSNTAEQAGYSRILGGYHIAADNIEGLAMGQKVGAYVTKWFEGKSNHAFPLKKETSESGE